MKFYEYLCLYEEMTSQQAMKVFGISSVPSKEELNKLYKSLSKKRHPDLGGSEEDMKELNQAKDVLDRDVFGKRRPGVSFDDDRDEIKKYSEKV